MIKVSIACNDCGAIGDHRTVEKPHLITSPLDLAKLRTRGWDISICGDKDICPSCIKIANAEKEEAGCSTNKEETNSKQCDSPYCPGWILTEDEHRIERCDTCKRFKDDEEAVDYVKSLESLDWNRHKSVKVREPLSKIKEALLCFLNDSQDMSATPETAQFISRVEGLLGRVVWLEESSND